MERGLRGENRIRPHDYHYAPAFNAEDKNHLVIGIGIIVEDTPLYFDCMNDAGLAVAGLNFAKYCKYATEAVNFTTNVAAYEFPCGSPATSPVWTMYRRL